MTSLATTKAHLCPAVRYGAVQTHCLPHLPLLDRPFGFCHGIIQHTKRCFPPQDEEEEEMDEVEEADGLEDAEEAANRRMDMTSEGATELVCHMTGEIRHLWQTHQHLLLLQLG